MTFVRFGIIVTGHGEERFLPKLFGLLQRISSVACHFEVIRRIGQRRPQGEKKQLVMVG